MNTLIKELSIYSYLYKPTYNYLYKATYLNKQIILEVFLNTFKDFKILRVL